MESNKVTIAQLNMLIAMRVASGASLQKDHQLAMTAVFECIANKYTINEDIQKHYNAAVRDLNTNERLIAKLIMDKNTLIG